MTPVTYRQFWGYTVGLLLVWLIVLSTASVTSDTADAPLPNTLAAKGNEKEREIRHARNCKALCGDCGCMGFYCGEECICECNNDKADTECITTMQRTARSLRIPFELLIQGPSSNRFVRNAAVQFEQNDERRRAYTMERNKRSTVLIYKPNANSAAGERPKRAVGPNLEWFSDIASTLVRPAPLASSSSVKAAQSARAIDEATATATQFKRSADERPWFAENTSMLIRPSPLFKRQSGSSSRRTTNAKNNDVGNFDSDSDEATPSFDAVKMMERLPEALQQTLRNIQESALSEDFTDTLRSKIKEGTDALQNTFGNGNFDMRDARQRQAKNFEEAFRNMNLFRSNFGNEPATTTAVPVAAAGRNVLPWFRPVRFLHRVNQAIN